MLYRCQGGVFDSREPRVEACKLPALQGVRFGFSGHGLPLFDVDSSSSDGPVFIEDWTKWGDAERQHIPAGRAARGPDTDRGERLQEDGEPDLREEKVSTESIPLRSLLR